MTGFLRTKSWPSALHLDAGYRLVAWLFLRLLALIYLAAFTSLASHGYPTRRPAQADRGCQAVG
jgi:hypothetical protein